MQFKLQLVAYLAEDEPPLTEDVFTWCREDPNPAELGAATASFTLAQSGAVGLRILDEKGRLVRTVLAGQAQPAGPRQVPLPLEGLPAGLYLVQLEAAGTTHTGKLLVQ